MRTRENSVVVSIRIAKELNKEFHALCAELGVQSSRMLLSAMTSQVQRMREDANKRRQLRDYSTWEDHWRANKD